MVSTTATVNFLYRFVWWRHSIVRTNCSIIMKKLSINRLIAIKDFVEQSQHYTKHVGPGLAEVHCTSTELTMMKSWKKIFKIKTLNTEWNESLATHFTKIDTLILNLVLFFSYDVIFYNFVKSKYVFGAANFKEKPPLPSRSDGLMRNSQALPVVSSAPADRTFSGSFPTIWAQFLITRYDWPYACRTYDEPVRSACTCNTRFSCPTVHGKGGERSDNSPGPDQPMEN